MHPVLFHVLGFGIPTYGVLYLLAFLTAILMMAHVGRQSGIRFSRMVDLGFLMAISGEVGARLTFLIVEIDRFLDGSITFTRFMVAGRVQMGGVVGAVLFIIWYTRRHRIPVLPFLDAAFTGAALGIGIGRIGCLAAGCCFGSHTDSWWGITFTDRLAEQFSGTPLGVPLHPTQILQSINGFLLFAALFFLHRRRSFPGQVAAVFLLYQGVARFIIEFLRGDPRGGILGLATSQWISLGFLAGGGILYYCASRRNAARKREREWQFEVEDLEPVYLRLLEDRFGPSLEIRPAGRRELRDTYLDTDTWSIHEAGFAFRVRCRDDRAEATIKSLHAGDSELRDRLEITEELKIPVGRISPQSVPNEVGRRLLAMVRDAEIRPYLELVTIRRSFMLVAGERTLAEISLDHTTIPTSPESDTGILLRVEVELVEGSEEEVLPFLENLRSSTGLVPATVSKLEAGLAATGKQPPRPAG